MAKKFLRFFAHDAGGLNALVPVIRLALAAGHDVRLYLEGPSDNMFRNGSLKNQFNELEGLHWWSRLSDGRFNFFREHDVTVVGSSQSPEGVRASVAVLTETGGRKRVLVEDMYGSALPTLNLLPVDRQPHRICVIDPSATTELTAGLTVSLPDWCQILVTGGPQFDPLIEVRDTFKERRANRRQQLGLAPADNCIVIMGGLNGTSDMLAIAHDAIESTRSISGMIIVVPHPTRQSLQDAWITGLAMEELDLLGPVPILCKGHDAALTLWDTYDLLAVADFVLGAYGTGLHEAILLGLPGVVYCSSPAINWNLWDEKQLTMPVEVTDGAGWYVNSGEQLVEVMDHIAKKTVEYLKLCEAQERMRECADGNAARSVWEVIDSHL